MARMNVFCKSCKHKSMDKNIDEPCKRCAGTHIYSNYLFYKSEGCDFCNGEHELVIDTSGINYCPKCGRKLT